MMYSVLCLIALIGAASAQWRCEGPQAFESSIQEFVPGLNFSIPLGRFSYDGYNQRTRTLEMVVTNQTKKNMLEIIYYKRCKIMFVYNMETKKCKRIEAVDVPLRPMSIPEDAKYLADTYVGSAGVPLGGLLVQTWVGNSTEAGGYSYMNTLTRHGCLPMTMSLHGKTFGYALYNFFNIVLGIADPNVFTPPKACFTQGQVLPEDLPHIYQQIEPKHLRKPATLYEAIRKMHRDNL